MSTDKKCVKKLMSLWDQVNWELEEERHLFYCQLSPLIKNWEGALPNLQHIFWPEEIDWLLVQDIFKKTNTDKFPLIDFLIRTGYKDNPEQDKDGKPLDLRRTTPIHYAARCSNSEIVNVIRKLFKIYNRFDVNYVDEKSGYTHFHVACECGLREVVEKFLECEQDTNCLVQKTGDAPLHLALAYYHIKTAKVLLRNDANPNLADVDGSTPLHIMCKRTRHTIHDTVVQFFKICDELNKSVQVNARDKLGRTPLHLALFRGHRKLVKLLLTRGADPNMASNDGSTALHVICKIQNDGDSAKKFFDICDDILVEVDAVDDLDRTPLQWAVANLLPDVVEVLLDHGADVSGFVFPTEDYFAERYQLDCTLQMVVLPTMSIIKSLENKGYELDQNIALMIMNTFVKHGLIDESVNLNECLRIDKNFMNIAKKQLVSSNLSLYDFLQLPPEEAEKVFTLEDYKQFTSEISDLCDDSHRAFTTYLCETVTYGFFRQWAMKLFLKKNSWLSKHYCEMFIKQLKIKALWEICMQAVNEGTQWLDFVRTDYVKKYYNRDLTLSYSFRASM